MRRPSRQLFYRNSDFPFGWNQCGKKDCVVRGTHMCMCYLEGITFSVLISLYLSPLWLHNCTRHFDIVSASCMSQVLLSMISTLLFWKIYTFHVTINRKARSSERESEARGGGASFSGLLMVSSLLLPQRFWAIICSQLAFHLCTGFFSTDASSTERKATLQ